MFCVLSQATSLIPYLFYQALMTVVFVSVMDNETTFLCMFQLMQLLQPLL